ncbi:hypothetical protein OIU77_000332 [Salix suchowensis]|uniref:CdiI immunity protein domain-containing protein n=1 Tax=Salix suchowensis TaxID=1278906 RepID=A0ABQ9B743_9ROSI|nr:hypothetical protein OIU77_000332 [Salix suchowensis]
MLISRSLTISGFAVFDFEEESGCPRVYALREAFTLFDFEDESIEDLKMLVESDCDRSDLFEDRRWEEVLGGLTGVLKEEFEDGFLQSLIEGSIYANSSGACDFVRRVLGGFVSQRITDGVENLLFPAQLSR